MRYIITKKGAEMMDSPRISIRPQMKRDIAEEYDITDMPKKDREKLQRGDKKVLTAKYKSIKSK
jgi:hypothetical protein